jgi:hypothetical protein
MALMVDKNAFYVEPTEEELSQKFLMISVDELVKLMINHGYSVTRPGDDEKVIFKCVECGNDIIAFKGSICYQIKTCFDCWYDKKNEVKT